ncbi:MAG: sulfur carrier protein ThiS [Aquificaceae bacterium]|nr:sulfur carrier protein ThiS [Aquificaceae bacterium]MCS7196124.1 sulfur carrier protein ThiS [Aquificaceae bacterium]MCX7989868.1 sulfur carrier protein ThiS [Aquificaceae bacterium]MDW8032134.1 sulfur carrier protein ThiS [Aquificaceae bacterium]MDW8293955.1 sulfur carrier protein ThiS [Aquificaceae bacterium]
MKLLVNGKELNVKEDITLEELLSHMDIPLRPVGLAVAVNEEVVPKSKYGVFRLKEGDKVEIVNIVGGG